MDRADDRKSEIAEWLAPQEAAAYLKISLGTLRNWTSMRYIPFARRGRVVRYRRHDLDAWLMCGSCAGRTTIAEVRYPRRNRNRGEA